MTRTCESHSITVEKSHIVHYIKGRRVWNDGKSTKRKLETFPKSNDVYNIFEENIIPSIFYRYSKHTDNERSRQDRTRLSSSAERVLSVYV